MKFKQFVFLCIVWCVVPAAFSSYSVGDHVSDFTLYNADHNEVSLHDYEGNAVMLIFWSSS